jgi:hypothetical protein
LADHLAALGLGDLPQLARHKRDVDRTEAELLAGGERGERNAEWRREPRLDLDREGARLEGLGAGVGDEDLPDDGDAALLHGEVEGRGALAQEVGRGAR